MPKLDNDQMNGANPAPRRRPADPRAIPAANQGGADSAEDPEQKRAADAEEQTVRRDIENDPRAREIEREVEMETQS